MTRRIGGALRAHAQDKEVEMEFGRLTPPEAGTRIGYEGGRLQVPEDPIIPFIEGDGIGADITPAMRRVVDAAVEKAYGGRRHIVWWPVPAGELSHDTLGEWLPQETIDAIGHYRVAIKGPMTTPVGGGIRSLNVALRQELDLYACVRPVRWFEKKLPRRSCWDVALRSKAKRDCTALIWDTPKSLTLSPGTKPTNMSPTCWRCANTAESMKQKPAGASPIRVGWVR